MARSLRKSEVEELASTVRHWLGAIEAGELSAPAATVQHLEGALIALDAVLGEPFEIPGLQ